MFISFLLVLNRNCLFLVVFRFFVWLFFSSLIIILLFYFLVVQISYFLQTAKGAKMFSAAVAATGDGQQTGKEGEEKIKLHTHSYCSLDYAQVPLCCCAYFAKFLQLRLMLI